MRIYATFFGLGSSVGWLTYVFARKVRPSSRPADSKKFPSVRNLPTITDNNDFAPNSVWMRSCQGMGVEKVVKMTRLAPLSSYSGLIGCGYYYYYYSWY